MTDEELESMEIDWTQGVAENFERVKSAALAALDAANKRADEAEARRKCYECGSEMTACAQCNPELVSAELATLRARVAELEAGGCARDQGTTQYCAEAVALQKRVDALEGALEPFAKAMKWMMEDFSDDYTPDWSPFIPYGAYRKAHAALKKEPTNDAG